MDVSPFWSSWGPRAPIDLTSDWEMTAVSGLQRQLRGKPPEQGCQGNETGGKGQSYNVQKPGGEAETRPQKEVRVRKSSKRRSG